MPHLIYEINSHVWLPEQPWYTPGRPDLADVPDRQIEEWRACGIDFLWLLGAWTKGDATRDICLHRPDLLAAFEKVLPGVQPRDILGSPFSIAAYRLSPCLGNDDTLPRLRKRLNDCGIRLMLDFVPNHMAVDHPWTRTHPARFVRGTDVEFERKPGDYFRVPDSPGTILAHGRDPFFSAWTDTAQINLFSVEARRALLDELLAVSDRCDAVRCDMAMLMTNQVFIRTWGDLSVMDYPDGDPREFWEEAIAEVKHRHPDFLFLAEVYWGLERKLQGMGFDFTYDKTLYDLARTADGAGIRGHLYETRDCEERMVRFLENHDESRAATAFGRRHPAIAVLVAALPGARLFQEGQFENRRAHLPVQLGVRPTETPDPAMQAFYHRLLRAIDRPALQRGLFRPLYVSEAWAGNPTARHIVTYWRSLDGEHYLVAANIGDFQSQAYTEIPVDILQTDVLEFRDLLGDALYHRAALQLKSSGLYLDLPPGGYHLFRVSGVSAPATPDNAAQPPHKPLDNPPPAQ